MDPDIFSYLLGMGATPTPGAAQTLGGAASMGMNDTLFPVPGSDAVSMQPQNYAAGADMLRQASQPPSAFTPPTPPPIPPVQTNPTPMATLPTPPPAAQPALPPTDISAQSKQAPMGGKAPDAGNSAPLANSNAFVNALKAVQVPKPPEVQKVSTPHLPAAPAVRGGNLAALLNSLALPTTQAAAPQYALPSTLSAALGVR